MSMAQQGQGQGQGAATSLPPEFRFHPTDEELILHYLCNRAAAAPCPVPIIADLDIYNFDPWDLPSQAVYGDNEWYFFSPRDRKYPNGIRPNRAAGSGYWKATGTDKPIYDAATGQGVGVKKALVFYKGRLPKGTKTAWIMHEYHLAIDPLAVVVNTYRPIKFRNISMRGRKKEGAKIMDPEFLIVIDVEAHDTGFLDTDVCIQDTGRHVVLIFFCDLGKKSSDVQPFF